MRIDRNPIIRKRPQSGIPRIAAIIPPIMAAVTGRFMNSCGKTCFIDLIQVC